MPPTYSQTVYFQSFLLHGPDARGYLVMLFGLTRKGADGVTITGQGAQANVTLTIPGGGLSSDAETYSNKGTWFEYYDRSPNDERELLRRANLLFKKLNPLTVSSSDYSVYGHASYLLERCATRWSRHLLFSSPGNPYNEVLTPP